MLCRLVLWELEELREKEAAELHGLALVGVTRASLDGDALEDGWRGRGGRGGWSEGGGLKLKRQLRHQSVECRDASRRYACIVGILESGVTSRQL